MSISLDFGRYNNYEISDSRMSKMIGEDRKAATKMSLWEQFKDLFRTDKKANAYNELFNMLHETEKCDKLDSFNKLKSFAKAEYQALFKKEIFCDNVVFFIGDTRISESSIQKLINVTEQTYLPTMSMQEQRLFLDMLDSLRKKEPLYDDSKLSHIRHSTSYEYRHELFSLYRPEETVDDNGTECNMAEPLTKDEEDSLRCLNAGSMTLFSQFSFMGYQKTASGVEFTMVHPLISFLQGTYTRATNDNFPYREVNSGFLTIINRGYEEYHNDKTNIDAILKRIYYQHNGTLSISVSDQNRNKLVIPFDVDIDTGIEITTDVGADIDIDTDVEYVMKDNDFSDDKQALSDSFKKWTNPDLHLSDDGTWYMVDDSDL